MHFNHRHFGFTLAIIVDFVFTFDSLQTLVKSSFSRNLHTHFLMIPAVSVYLIYINRKTIFKHVNYTKNIGLGIMSAGLGVFLCGLFIKNKILDNDHQSLMMLSFLCWLYGSLILFYGSRVFKNAAFPLLFLLFMVPIPSFVINPFVKFLYLQSANAVDFLLALSGTHYLREGIIFHLSNFDIMVAEECSGIRSSLAMFIISTLAGYVYLKNYAFRSVLVLAVIPVTIFKNGLRIVTITLMANYVDIHYLTDSSLHSSGGKTFLLLALLMLLPVLWVLKKLEEKRESSHS